MPIPKINNKAPVFKGECTGNKTISLSDLKGKNVVLYFYPKDSTPGCTTEGQDFRDLKAQFTKANTVIFGLSRESIKSHENQCPGAENQQNPKTTKKQLAQRVTPMVSL